MIILSNEEIESFLSIKTCIDALEKAYASWDKGTAINRPRTDLVMPSATEAGVYAFKSMEAGLYDPPIVAMRINSDIIRWTQQGNRTIKTKLRAAPGDKYVGLVMLFSTVTGEPLAMFPDGVVQRMRVASSSALGGALLRPRRRQHHGAVRFRLAGRQPCAGDVRRAAAQAHQCF